MEHQRKREFIEKLLASNRVQLLIHPKRKVNKIKKQMRTMKMKKMMLD
jgi:hypothetical protein